MMTTSISTEAQKYIRFAKRKNELWSECSVVKKEREKKVMRKKDKIENNKKSRNL